MPDFGDENVLQFAVDAFAETVALKLQQLRQFVPRKRDETNTDLTGAFVEELVRGFIRDWIGQKLLLHGTFYYQKHVDSCDKPLQIDGIVYDPTRGPVILREGDFVVVHPAFCSGVIEIKMSVSSLPDFEKRLVTVYDKYMSHRTRPSIMGVLISHNAPEKASELPVEGGGTMPLYHHAWANICPIFILFKETADGEFLPHRPAIEGLIRAIYNNLMVTTNYIG